MFLVELLERRVAYRNRWQAKVRRQRGPGINQAAVATVLAEYLWANGEAEDSDILPRGLRDRVARVVSGHTITAGTPDWFIAAFRMTEDDATRLRALRASAGSLQFISGDLEYRSEMGEVPLEHQTLSLHEFHYVGPDRRPTRHRTVQVIRAIRDRVIRYPYRFDTDALAVEVLRGGTAGPLYRISEALCAVDVLLHKPLALGQTASLEYETIFHYPEPPEPHMRRAVLRRVDSVEIRVEFHRDRRPRRVRWAVWDGLHGDVVREEPVALDADNAVHRFLDGVESAVIGFAWDW